MTVFFFYAYDAWGKITNQTETVPNSIKYAGEYTDAETGFVYLRNRCYDPTIRRFTSEDPARDELNWYAYCGNNPVMFTDPMGLAEKRFVLEDSVRLRRAPGSNSEVYDLLSKGTEVNYTGRKTGTINGYTWAQVTVNGITGWVAANFLGYEHPNTAAPRVFVGRHSVLAFGIDTTGSHSNVIIFADPNSELVKNNSDIFNHTIEYEGRRWVYATLGASERNNGAYGKLVAKPNRDSDVGVVTGVSPNGYMIEVAASYAAVTTLLSSDKYFRENYNGKITYGASMPANSNWYNSNSYARGLLDTAGITAPILDGWFPGWDKPIPGAYYGQ